MEILVDLSNAIMKPFEQGSRQTMLVIFIVRIGKKVITFIYKFTILKLKTNFFY